MIGFVTRTRRVLRRHGLVGSLRRAGSLGARAVYLSETHVWYELDLGRERPPNTLPAGLELRRAREDDLATLEDAEAVGAADAARRLLAGGAELWLVVDGSDVAFRCWVFRRRTPALAARGGWLGLPPGTVCLENSYTMPAYRGRGIAPAAWTAIADTLAAAGVSTMVTKVEEENATSRHAVEKSGFREVVLMTLVRAGWRSRVNIRPLESDAPAFLARELSR